MAGVGAVKELSGITDNIIDKIDELEQVMVPDNINEVVCCIQRQ